jgi:3-oxoadipate CoA-transferase, beta subunit
MSRPNGLSMALVAGEAALDIADGSCVNLGIGLPTRVAGLIPPEREIIVHSENGIVGMGPAAVKGHEDWNLIDAGKAPVTIVQGASFVSHADSFALIRAGYVDVSIMGAYQVSNTGDLANWFVGSGIPAVGGAMDLASGAKSVRIIMRHTSEAGVPKLVHRCTLPLTAPKVVSRVYTELGIFDIRDERIIAVALAVDIDSVRDQSGVPIDVSSDCLELPRKQNRALTPSRLKS